MREFVSDVSDYDDSPSPKPRRTRGIIATVLLVVVLLSGVIGFVSFTLISNNRLKEMSGYSTKAVSETDLVIQGYLDSHTATLRGLLDDETVRQMGTSAASKENILTIFDATLKAQPDVSAIYLGTQDGRMLLQPVQELPADYNPTDRPWYKASVVTKDPLTSAPYADAVLNDLFISMSAPVASLDTDEVAGVLGMDISMKGLNQLINSIGFGNDGFVIVLSPDLLILSHPNPELVGMPLNVEDLQQNEHVSSAEYSLNQLKPLADALQNGNDFEEYRLEYKADGRKQYAQVKKTQLGWYIISTFSEQRGF